MNVFWKNKRPMEEVRNLDKKRVFDKSMDGKLIVLRRQNCVTRITANADQTMNISHSYEK